MRSPRRLLLLPLAALAVGTPSASAATCAGADVAPGGQPLAAAQQAVLCLTNEQRTTAGLQPLRSEATLEAAGQAYSTSMVTLGFFAHVSPTGSTLKQRLVAYTDWTSIGENLYTGTGTLATPRAAVDGWMRSEGHRANLLNPEYRDVGLGVAQGSPGTGRGDSATYAAEYGARPLSGYAERDDATPKVFAAPASAKPVTPARPVVVLQASPSPQPADAAVKPAASVAAAKPAVKSARTSHAGRVRMVMRRCSKASLRHVSGRSRLARRCAALRARVQARRAKKSRRAAAVLQKAMSSHGTSAAPKARISGASGVSFGWPSASAS